MYRRTLKLPKPQEESFFLWGPRQVGKTHLLQTSFPNVPFVQLLKNEEFAAYQESPQLLRQRVTSNNWDFVIIDEVQKIPQLLDEVHFLIEERGTQFGLCGSSARKVRRGHANLLGGRALRFELLGLTSHEVGIGYDLERLLNVGYLPKIYDSSKPQDLLRAYCADYLAEEIRAEGLLRNLAPFQRFMTAVALGDTEVLNFQSFARDVGVSAPTVRSYFEILSETLLGRFLQPWTRRSKRRVLKKPKFYFADVGVVNQLARRGKIEPQSSLWGKCFENWVCHELHAWISYKSPNTQLSFWQLSSGIEVDFVVGDMNIALESKATKKITSDHLKGLRQLAVEHPEIQKRYVVSCEEHSRTLDDGIEILSHQDFTKRLWSGDLIPEGT